MLQAAITCDDTHLRCHVTGRDIEWSPRLDDGMLEQWRGWAERYEKATQANNETDLLAIGCEIGGFLDSGNQWLARALASDPTGDIVLEVAVAARHEAERTLLDIPWELLATEDGYLTLDAVRLFRLSRRIGVKDKLYVPKHADLTLMFMAADPIDQVTLDYEQEEAALLQATSGASLHVLVEESGTAAFLRTRLAAEEAVEVLHLSCHGDLVDDRPMLALETAEGALDLVEAGRLSGALGEHKPPLVALSACRTGEQGLNAAPFAVEMVRAGVANVLGWDGSVYDQDAIAFAACFYERLADGQSVSHAAAVARQQLLQSSLTHADKGRHWHLARVYHGPAGGGSLCDSGKEKRRFRRDAGYKEFLDTVHKEVEVARADQFVGRRREIQRVLAAFRERRHTGVLIHGMGNLGKSSLAARIASRLPHHRTVVIYKRYEALTIFDRVVEALPPAEQITAKDSWRSVIEQRPETLKNALQELLDGPFAREYVKARRRPILLVIDDLEKILETPRPGQAATPVKAEHVEALQAVLAAFRDVGDTESHLLLTSRFVFRLDDGRGGDLAARDLSRFMGLGMGAVGHARGPGHVLHARDIACQRVLVDHQDRRVELGNLHETAPRS